jgi:hypothetical protein
MKTIITAAAVAAIVIGSPATGHTATFRESTSGSLLEINGDSPCRSHDLTRLCSRDLTHPL